MTRNPRYPSSRWLDTSAPFTLVEATVAVRDALADPVPEYHYLGGRCREASHVLALGLKRIGWNAKCMPASRLGDGHFVVLADRWMLDPTAEQFGVEGPFVCQMTELPHPCFELEPMPGATFEPSELELICRLAGDYRPGEANTAAAVLTAMGLSHLERAVRETSAGTDDRRRCFCGAGSVGWHQVDIFVTWGCESHLRPARAAR